MTLLLVDDEAIVRDTLKDSLSMLYDIEVASNTSEAISILEKRNSPDTDDNFIECVITDLNMPDVDGKGSGACLIDYIIDKAYDIPIIVITAYNKLSDEYSKISCLEVIPKPIVVNDVIRSIDRLQKSFKVCTEDTKCNLCNTSKYIKLANIQANEIIKYLQGGTDGNTEK